MVFGSTKSILSTNTNGSNTDLKSFKFSHTKYVITQTHLRHLTTMSLKI